MLTSEMYNDITKKVRFINTYLKQGYVIIKNIEQYYEEQ